MKCYDNKCKKQAKYKFKLQVDTPKAKMELEGKFCDEHFQGALKYDVRLQ